MITVRVDDAVFRAVMADLGARQVPYATALALTRTAQRGQREAVREMERVFDRPTRFTLNSLFVRPARKNALFASVEFRDFASKGTPAAKYIKPEVEGGPRRATRFEGKLMHRGLLAQGQHLVPTKAVPRDAFGNPTRGQYPKILSALQAQSTDSDNSKADKARASGYFWGNPHGMGMGIWQRFTLGHGKALKPMFLEVRTPQYKVRLRFKAIQERIVDAWFATEFAIAVHLARKTAK